MHLQSFHVRVFRNIIDSGPVTVDDVTCIVGKNEAGKSALLQALHNLNPAKPAATLSLLDEYPRWLKKEHEITGEIEDATPITATFVLTESELAELEDAYGEDVMSSPEFTASRKYSDPTSLEIDADINYRAFVNPFIASSPARLQKRLGSPSTVTDLRKSISQSVVAEDESDEAAALASDAQAALARLDQALGAGKNLRSVIEAWLRARLPRTFYFTNYAQLGGRYNFEEVFRAVQGEIDEDEDGNETIQTAADFLKLARISPDAAGNWDYEESNSELESVSSLLTKRVAEQWRQNKNLRLRVSIEPQRRRLPDGHEQIDRFLQLRVEDTRHDFSNRLDRRSTGFRWFVSFIASFLEFEKDKSIILLLDEPGLSLHARAQMDLLDTIENKLAQGRQVLYSTHSPFMVRADNLGRTRISEDQGPDLGSTITNDAGVVSDSDTLFPLQAALGYDIVQSLFIGNKNVLVEGVSDYIYLTMISQHLKALSRTSLLDQTRLLPAGGAANIPTFIALVGTQLDVVVLLDGNTPRQRIESTIRRGRLSTSKIIDIADFTDVKDADIEDLFTPEEYLKLYNGTHRTRLKEGDLNGSDRITKRIERARGDFDHGEVAAYFLRNLEKSIKDLSDETLARFEKAIEAINAALS
jgi:predicted ATP-dependent endonuclease of OLD family